MDNATVMVKKQIRRCIEGGGKKGKISIIWLPKTSPNVTKTTLRMKFELDDDADNPTKFGWVMSTFSRQFDLESMSEEEDITSLMAQNSNLMVCHQKAIDSFNAKMPIHFVSDTQKLNDQLIAIPNYGDVFTVSGFTTKFQALMRDAKKGSTTSKYNAAASMMQMVYSVTATRAFFEPEEQEEEKKETDITGSYHAMFGGANWDSTMQPATIKPWLWCKGPMFGHFIGSIFLNTTQSHRIITGRPIFLARTEEDNTSSAISGPAWVEAWIYQSPTYTQFRPHALFFTLALQDGQLSLTFQKIWARGIGETKILEYPNANNNAGCIDVNMVGRRGKFENYATRLAGCMDVQKMEKKMCSAVVTISDYISWTPFISSKCFAMKKKLNNNK